MSPVMLVLGDAVGEAAAAEALSTAFTATTIWAAITPFIPVICTIALVSLGIYFFRKIVKKASKGKAI